MFARAISWAMYPVTGPFFYFFPGEPDFMKDREKFLKAPFESIPKKQVTNGFASKEFIETLRNKGQERYSESHVRKGKNFTLLLTGISDAIEIDEKFSHSSTYEKGEYIVSENNLPLSANMLDGYFLNIVSNGQKAGYLIGTDRSGLNTVKKILDDISIKLVAGETLEGTVKWLRDESDYTSRGSTNHSGRLLLIN